MCHQRRSPHGVALFRALMLLALLTFQFVPSSAQYRFTQWTADAGLPQDSVRGLVQTPDGFLWVATLNGIARFDGVRFRVFDKSNTPGISSSRFIAMVLGEGTDLWTVGEDGNVMRLHDGVFTTFGEAAGVRPHSVDAITADGRGGVWIKSDSVVMRWDREHQKFVPESFSTGDLHFLRLWWVGTGFWAVRDRELICFERGRLQRVPLPAAVKPQMIRGIASGADGAIWIGTIDGRLGRILGDEPFQLQSIPYFTPMLGFSETTWNAEISNTNFERKLHFPSEGLNPPITYNVLIHDNEGNIWVGSEAGGLYRIQKQSVQVLSAAQGLASNNVYPILHARNGDMWVGSWPSGLSQVRNGRVIRIFAEKDGLPGHVASLAEDRDGALWIGSHGGTRKLFNGRLIEPKLPGMETRSVAQVIHPASDGTMWFGTPAGLYIIRNGQVNRMTVAEGLAADDVRVIVDDRHGDTWIGGYGGLTRMHAGKLTRWTETDGLPSNNIRCIFEDAEGDMWVGTYDGGIGWYRNGHWITFNKDRGLFDNGAFQILEDDRKRFWISSNRGLYRVSKADFAAVADGRESLVTSIAYGRSDGMLSVECNGGLWPAGAKDSNGALWFPTQVGVAIIDPAKIQNSQQAPTVAIDSALVEHKLQPALASIALQPGQTNLEVNYTALSYTKPEQITFRYKLEGMDGEWQEVGLRRTAYYSHLSPGEYTFVVGARNSDGIYSKQLARMRIVVVPPFFRRWWFLALVAVVVLCIVSAVWRVRIAQLQDAQARQQKFSRELIASQEGERRRIAAELHDSLGQRLIIINNLALFLLRSKGRVRTDEEKRETVEEISGEASAAIEETRAISYALRPFQLDRLGLTRAIQALCTTVTKASEITVRTELADIDDAFAEDLRINVYRIVQEGLNNIVKHSGASTARVTARRSSGNVTLTIEDDGRGMPAKPRVHQPGAGGFGMTGMRERITLLNGTMQVQSSAVTGTLLTIQLPITKSASL